MTYERGSIRDCVTIICCLSRPASPEPHEIELPAISKEFGTPVSSPVLQSDDPLIPPTRPPPLPELGPNRVTVGDEIFQEALQSYGQKLSPAHRQAFIDASACGLIGTIKVLDEKHSTESSVRSAAVKVQGFLQVADAYLTVVGICIQHHPDISALVIGGLKLFVDIGRRYVGFFDKLNQTMDTLSGNLDYLARYANLCGDDVDVRAALCEAYGDLIAFCTTACGIFMDEEGKMSKRISAKVLFKQLSSPLETSFDALNTSFTEHIRKVENMGNIRTLEKQYLKEKVEARRTADTERGSLLSWLSKLEPEADLERIYTKRHADTGRWFVESRQLNDWLGAEHHKLLWCYGSPGVGKSVLLSILVQEISSQHVFDERIGIAFFYFNFQNEVTTQTESSFLEILLKQLCRRKTEFPETLKALYKECRRNNRKPSLAQLRLQFEEIAMTFDQVFLMIDALEECAKDQRQKFLQYITSLLQLPAGKLKILVTSRPERDIMSHFTSGSFPVIQIEATNVAEDIASYVRHELLHRTHPYCNLKDALELRMEVEQVLISKSNGMFLWVACQLVHIYQQPSEQHIKRSLESLPEDMTGTYRRMLDNIDRKPLTMRVIAKRALTWVMAACRPLTLKELVLAVAIEPESKCRAELALCEPQAVIDACGGLLVNAAGEVRPIHFTVQEFLIADGWVIGSMMDANAEIARSSLRFILFEDFLSVASVFDNPEGATERAPKPKPEYGSFDRMYYIWSFWDQHVRCLSSPLPDEVKDLLRQLFRSPHKRAAYISRVGDFNEDFTEDLTEDSNHYALCATMDLLPLYSQLFPSDQSALTSQELKNALRNAARGGALHAIKVVFDLMSKEDFSDNKPLNIAAGAGHVEAVRLLIELGLNINASTALQAAASAGRDFVVKYIIENGGDVNIQGGQYDTALQAAAAIGNQSIVEILLANGAKADMKGGQYGTALQAAAAIGNQSIVETLLANGANADMKGGQYGTALQAAAAIGNQSVVEILLANGAKDDKNGGQYGSALQAAAALGNQSIVETLLTNGAMVNILGGVYGSALQAATTDGHDKIVVILLANGADVDNPIGGYGNALLAATSGGHDKIVQILLANGANVDIRGGKYGTALQAAAACGCAMILQPSEPCGCKTIVELLLANGANVNIQGGMYGTALQAAVAWNHIEIVKILLANGANVNIQGGRYGNALGAAQSKNNTVLVTMLEMFVISGFLFGNTADVGNLHVE